MTFTVMMTSGEIPRKFMFTVEMENGIKQALLIRMTSLYLC